MISQPAEVLVSARYGVQCEQTFEHHSTFVLFVEDDVVMSTGTTAHDTD